jgi:hypothetical protein
MRLAAAPTLGAGAGWKTRRALALAPADALDCAFAIESFTANPEDAMAKGQMRSNKEKKKPKQDKNKDKGAPAPSPFAGMHSQTNPKPYGKK